MPRFEDLTGKKFGRWTVIKREENDKNNCTRWLVECSCEKRTRRVIGVGTLKSGNSKSCGCLRNELYRKRIEDVDLTGLKKNYLEVLEFDRYENSRRYWKCKCLLCGKEGFSVSTASINNGSVQSCGCLREINLSKKIKKHGLTKTKLHATWLNMKRRCYSEKDKHYKDYGARGIKVCKEWLDDFCNFRDWAYANGYSDELSIDRIDVNKDYEPSNCRWVDAITQANNKRNSRFLTYNNETLTIAEWSRKTGIHPATIQSRLNEFNWSIGEALGFEKHRKGKLIKCNGELKTINEWCEIYNRNPKTVRKNLERNWSIEEALGIVKRERKNKKN